MALLVRVPMKKRFILPQVSAKSATMLTRAGMNLQIQRITGPAFRRA
jgi:hypothetical protein